MGKIRHPKKLCFFWKLLFRYDLSFFFIINTRVLHDHAHVIQAGERLRTQWGE